MSAGEVSSLNRGGSSVGSGQARTRYHQDGARHPEKAAAYFAKESLYGTRDDLEIATSIFTSFPLLCRIMSVSSSGYHAWRYRPSSKRTREDARLEVEILTAHKPTRQTNGPERLQEDLIAHKVIIGVHRIKRFRMKLGLRCRQTKKFKATTDSWHSLPVEEDLLAQQRAEGDQQTPLELIFEKIKNCKAYPLQ